jgi:hypothetical protein
MKLSTIQEFWVLKMAASTTRFEIEPHPLGSSAALWFAALQLARLFEQPNEHLTG